MPFRLDEDAMKEQSCSTERSGSLTISVQALPHGRCGIEIHEEPPRYTQTSYSHGSQQMQNVNQRPI
jgi:hypothetical protein